MEPRNIKSSKGGNKLVYKGYAYNYDAVSEDGHLKFWRCESRRAPDYCKVRFHQSAEMSEIIKQIHEYTHVPDASRMEVLQSLQLVRERALFTQEDTSQIVNVATAGLSQSAKGQMPKENLLKQVVRRKRKREDLAPVAPASLHDLVIPPNWMTYKYAEGDIRDFLLWDSGPGNDRIRLFSTQHNLDLLQQSTEWYCDGTFRVAPSLFSQLYTIHGEKMGAVHPLVYALLPSKQEATYTVVCPGKAPACAGRRLPAPWTGAEMVV